MSIAFGLRSWYSRKATGFLSPKDCVAAAKKAGASGIAFFDRHELAGVHEWLSSAKESELTALCGLELLLNWEDKKLPFLIFGRGPLGARRLASLVADAEITADEELCLSLEEGRFSELIVCTGGMESHFHRLVGRRDLGSAQRYLDAMQYAGARVLIGVDPGTTDPYYLKTIERFSAQAVIPYRPLIYADSEDHAAYCNVARSLVDGPPESWLSDLSIKTMAGQISSAKAAGGYHFDSRWDEILSREEASVGLGFDSISHHSKLLESEGIDLTKAHYELRVSTSRALRNVMASLPAESHDLYIERLRAEHGAIQQLEMAPYLLSLGKVVNRLRESGRPIGLGRGSSVNSLTCFLLGITQIDPVAEGLPFERFLNTSRADLPDVDIDVSRRLAPEIRHEVKGMFKGSAGFRNFTYPTARSVLPKIMAAQGIKKDHIDVFRNELRDRTDSSERTWQEIEARWPNALERLNHAMGSSEMGNKALEILEQVGYSRPLRASVHESGVAIGSEELVNICPLQPCLKEGERILCVAPTLKQAEEKGIVKIDILALDSLDQIDAINQDLALIGTKTLLFDSERRFQSQHALALLDRGFTAGIFQFENQSELLASVKPRSLNDLVFASALVRVIGPGHTTPEPPRCLAQLPADMRNVYDRITSKSRGLVVFQEQLMALTHEIAGFDLTKADRLRASVAKKTGELPGFRTEFILGVQERFGTNAEAAGLFFDEMTSGGSYLFNAGHARSYAQISEAQLIGKAENTAEAFGHMVRTMWSAPQQNKSELKARLGRLLYECRSLGLEVRNIDLTAQDSVCSIPIGDVSDVAPGVFGRRTVRLGLDLLTDIDETQRAKVQRIWQENKEVLPNHLLGVLRPEQVVGLICLGAWNNSRSGREELLGSVLQKATQLAPISEYQRTLFGFLTDEFHPGLAPGVTPVSQLDSPEFKVPDERFTIGGFVSSVGDLSRTGKTRSLRASVRLTTYLGDSGYFLSRFFSSEQEGEQWVHRHRAIGPLAPVTMLVEARRVGDKTFFNSVGEAIPPKEAQPIKSTNAIQHERNTSALEAALV